LQKWRFLILKNNKQKKWCIFAIYKNGNGSIAGRFWRREESPGNREPPYFLTGRGAFRKERVTESAAENYTAVFRDGKGENAR